MKTKNKIIISFLSLLCIIVSVFLYHKAQITAKYGHMLAKRHSWIEVLYMAQEVYSADHEGVFANRFSDLAPEYIGSDTLKNILQSKKDFSDKEDLRNKEIFSIFGGLRKSSPVDFILIYETKKNELGKRVIVRVSGERDLIDEKKFLEELKAQSKKLITSQRDKEASVILRGSFLEKYLNEDNPNAIYFAYQYIRVRSNGNIPVIEDNSTEGWKKRAKIALDWIEKQDAKTIENLVKDFPAFVKTLSPYDVD